MPTQVKKLIGAAVRGIHAITIVVTRIAGIGLGIMMLLIVSNILARFLFKKPLLGTIELVELLTLISAFFTVAYTEVRRGHVKVDLVVSRLPRRAQAVLASIVYFIGAAFFVRLAWQGGEQMWSDLFPIRVTNILYIPFAPFMFVIAFGSMLLGLEMLIHVFQPLPTEEEKGG